MTKREEIIKKGQEVLEAKSGEYWKITSPFTFLTMCDMDKYDYDVLAVKMKANALTEEEADWFVPLYKIVQRINAKLVELALINPRMASLSFPLGRTL